MDTCMTVDGFLPGALPTEDHVRVLLAAFSYLGTSESLWETNLEELSRITGQGEGTLLGMLWEIERQLWVTYDRGYWRFTDEQVAIIDHYYPNTLGD